MGNISFKKATVTAPKDITVAITDTLNFLKGKLSIGEQAKLLK